MVRTRMADDVALRALDLRPGRALEILDLGRGVEKGMADLIRERRLPLAITRRRSVLYIERLAGEGGR